MDYAAVERARERLEAAAVARNQQADVDAALDRARAQMAELGELAAQLESTLPDRIGEAVQDGFRAQALPVARQLAEVRGLAGQTIRRLERMEGDALAERNARVDDLALLVDLIASGWQSVDERLARIETAVQETTGAIVYRLDEAQHRRKAS
jgi:ribosome assembly protein YihI (activator of Der GTPase)